ncbi:MAG TPA: class I SAM-dependent methyltransferase [Stellaceae bacterium]|jgi:predicted O-methyltransferase YrrM|nr:class I SAM-dependent methyltransferase [Stellaceae bacterium]
MFRRLRQSWGRKQALSKHFYRRFTEKYFAHDVNFELQMMARHDAALYIRQNMPGANMYADRWRLLAAAVDAAPRQGMVLEFGVEKGASANFIAGRIAGRGDGAVVDAFDSFEGLPESWHGTYETRGKFNLDGRVPRLLPNVRVHRGWFDATLPGFRQAAEATRIALLHIDCDIYSSTRTVFDNVGDLLRPGSIVVFDEYFNYHGWELHEFKAWGEFVSARRVKYTYRGFCGQGGQVFLRIDEMGGEGAG